MFDRGLTYGSSGNLSVRLDDGFLLTPTNSCLGNLSPSSLSKIDANGQVINGDPPTKEWPLHVAIFENQPNTHAIVHLHSTYCTALSCLDHDDPETLIPPITPYFLMRIGKLAMVPYYMPGSKELAEAVGEAAKESRAILMANHGPIVASSTFEKAVFIMEELEETAKLTILLKNHKLRYLNQEQIDELIQKYGKQ